MVVFKLVNGTISERVLVNTEPVRHPCQECGEDFSPFWQGAAVQLSNFCEAICYVQHIASVFNN